MAEHESVWGDLQGVPFAQGYLDAGGVRTRYLHAGDSSKPALILLHGSGGHAEAYVRNLEAHANRGLANAQLRHYDEAIADYTEALRLNPRDEVLQYNRGNAHYCKADYDRAIADYSEAVRLDPKNAWAFGNRGKAYALNGDHARAVADFSRVLQLDPHNVRVLCDRAASHRSETAPSSPITIRARSLVAAPANASQPSPEGTTLAPT